VGVLLPNYKRKKKKKKKKIIKDKIQKKSCMGMVTGEESREGSHKRENS
jgi:hypothetical protein